MVPIRGSSCNLAAAPTAFSMRAYQSPIFVVAIKSLPVSRFLMGLKTPNTARSAKFGLEPPVTMQYKNRSQTLQISHDMTNQVQNCLTATKGIHTIQYGQEQVLKHKVLIPSQYLSHNKI